MKSYFYLQTKFSSLTVLQTNESSIEQFIIVQTLKIVNVQCHERRPRIPSQKFLQTRTTFIHYT